MATRRRPDAEFQATPGQLGQQYLTLDSLTGGYNGYSNPQILSPQFWAGASNVYSGLFSAIRRARFAPIENAANMPTFSSGTIITSLFSFSPQGGSGTYLIMENSNTGIGLAVNAVVYGSPATTIPVETFSFVVSASQIYGPYMRFAVNPISIVETNGIIRSKLRFQPPGTNRFLILFWGIDTPDSSPSIALSAGSSATLANPAASRTSNIATITATAPLPANFVVGNFANVTVTGDSSFNTPTGVAALITAVTSTTFSYANVGPNVATSGTGGTATVQITKTIGRSYSWAWEDDNGHVSAPSPASQYVVYNNQTGTINLIQPGTLSIPNSSKIVTGTNTAFSSAWVGRVLWVAGTGMLTSGGVPNIVASVQSSTQLTLLLNNFGAISAQQFQICDPNILLTGSYFIRLYATGDGGSVYFRVARNTFVPTNTTIATAGLQFIDTANSEPPNPPFTSEIAQLFNVPPPIGSFLGSYQGRIVVYGVSAALQSFFYSNIEVTVIGQPPESFAPLNQVTLPIGEAQINGTAELPTGFLIWSNHQDMFKLTGNLSDNTVANQFQLGATIQRLPYRIGCGSPYATAVTSLGAFWLSSDREVWLFTDHYAPKNVGKPIQDILNRINGSRIGFARMTNYKRGDRNWLALAIALDSSNFNNKLCLLDLDLLSSNGQPSFFTFDMATNQPSWYLYDINCESITTAYDNSSQSHLLVGDVDLITDADYHTGDYTITTEENVPGNVTQHALGNESPNLIKTMNWMRVTTNQLPKVMASQGWNWNILTADDDTTVLGVSTGTVHLVPGIDSLAQVLPLEYSPAVFRFGGVRVVKGRRMQIQTNFPSGPGFYELRGFEVAITNVAAR